MIRIFGNEPEKLLKLPDIFLRDSLFRIVSPDIADASQFTSSFCDKATDPVLFSKFIDLLP